MTKYFSVIFARLSTDGGFGFNGGIPWKSSLDMKFFSAITFSNTESRTNTLIMGRKTWLSLPPSVRNDRRIIVITSSKNIGIETCTSLDEALEKGSGNLFVIGGVRLLRECFSHNGLERIYCTTISPSSPNKYTCDVFFPDKIPKGFRLVSNTPFRERDGDHVVMETYHREVITDETKYLSLLERILEEGEERDDRTGVGTLSLFGAQIELDTSKYSPLLTTKKIYFKGVVEELLWFLRGETNVRSLQARGVHIWDGNTSREFLDKRGLKEYPVGELGPGYGFNMRHYGAEYSPDKKEYGGVDQIKSVIETIKKDPYSRRILISLWNPATIDQVALPPCHILFQLYTTKDKKMDGHLYMRSVDAFLGLPFNIASYTLLLYMISVSTGYLPRRLIVSMGDVHIYKNHIVQVKEQLSRPPRQFPKLYIDEKDGIDKYTYDCFKLQGYDPHPSIKGEMAV